MSIANGHLYVNGLIVAKVSSKAAQPGRVKLTRPIVSGREKEETPAAKRGRRGEEIKRSRV